MYFKPQQKQFKNEDQNLQTKKILYRVSVNLVWANSLKTGKVINVNILNWHLY